MSRRQFRNSTEKGIRFERRSFTEEITMAVNFCHGEGFNYRRTKFEQTANPSCPVAVVTRPLPPVIQHAFQLRANSCAFHSYTRCLACGVSLLATIGSGWNARNRRKNESSPQCHPRNEVQAVEEPIITEFVSRVFNNRTISSPLLVNCFHNCRWDDRSAN